MLGLGLEYVLRIWLGLALSKLRLGWSGKIVRVSIKERLELGLVWGLDC